MSLASQDGGYFYFKVLDSYRGSRDKSRIWTQPYFFMRQERTALEVHGRQIESNRVLNTAWRDF